MYKGTNHPMGSERAARAIYIVASVRGAIHDGIEMGLPRIMDLNRQRLDDAAGNGFPFIHMKSDSHLPPSRIASRLAKEITHFIKSGRKYTKRDDWMGR